MLLGFLLEVEVSARRELAKQLLASGALQIQGNDPNFVRVAEMERISGRVPN